MMNGASKNRRALPSLQKHKSPASAGLLFESIDLDGLPVFAGIFGSSKDILLHRRLIVGFTVDEYFTKGKSFSALPPAKTHPNVKSLFGLAKHQLRQASLNSEAELTNLKLISGHNHVV